MDLPRTAELPSTDGPCARGASHASPMRAAVIDTIAVRVAPMGEPVKGWWRVIALLAISEPRSDAHGLGAGVSRDPHQNRSV